MLSLRSWILGDSTDIDGSGAKNYTAGTNLDLALDDSCDDDSCPDEEDISEDWMVVVEDLASVRTIMIGDVHQQRVRNRPRLARWDATEDMLIEKPLVGPENKRVVTYATVARPSYAEALKLALKAQAQIGFNIAEPVNTCEEIWNPITRNSKGYSMVADQAQIEAHYGLVHQTDSMNWCPNSRVARRMYSRTCRHSPMEGGRAKVKVIKPRNRNSLSRPV